MDRQAYLTPWNIGGGVVGLVLSMAIIISLLINHHQVGIALKKASFQLFSLIGFFSLVIVVFMVISVLESGDFFRDLREVNRPRYDQELTVFTHCSGGQLRAIPEVVPGGLCFFTC